MDRLYLVIGALALVLFGYGNVHGWSLFESEAQMRTPGLHGSSGGLYHK